MDDSSPTLIGASCNCLALRRAARSVARRYDEALRPLDLNNGQFSMLTAIAALQPAGVQAIGERLGMDRTTVTAALKPMQRNGWIETAVAADDQRAREIRLTLSGAAILAEAVPLWEVAQGVIARQLGGQGASDTLRRQLAILA
jgi:DNA-binding MarR family transcriptional regulator